jgi:hypothetical protein
LEPHLIFADTPSSPKKLPPLDMVYNATVEGDDWGNYQMESCKQRRIKKFEGYTMKGTEKQHLSQICKIMCLLENLIWDNNS